MTRAEFMKAFRNDCVLMSLTANDCQEIFMGILKGGSDLTSELFTELCSSYGVDFEDIAKAHIKEMLFRRDVARRATAIDWEQVTKGKDKL